MGFGKKLKGRVKTFSAAFSQLSFLFRSFQSVLGFPVLAASFIVNSGLFLSAPFMKNAWRFKILSVSLSQKIKKAIIFSRLLSRFQFRSLVYSNNAVHSFKHFLIGDGSISFSHLYCAIGVHFKILKMIMRIIIVSSSSRSSSSHSGSSISCSSNNSIAFFNVSVSARVECSWSMIECKKIRSRGATLKMLKSVRVFSVAFIY